jgi:hypothetical protein
MDLPIPYMNSRGRKLIYAFNVTPEWLVEYANNCWRHEPNLNIYDSYAKAAAAVFAIKQRSGIQTLDLEQGVATPEDHAEGAITMDDRPGELMAPLLSICTSIRGSYRRRPTQVQFDSLVENNGEGATMVD